MPKIVPNELYRYGACDRLAYRLRDTTKIHDRFLDSHRHRLTKGIQALGTLQRLIKAGWCKATGRAEIVTLLITFPFLNGSNVWQRALIHHVQAKIDAFFEALSKVAGCSPIPHTVKVERSLGRDGLIHVHVETTAAGGEIYRSFATRPALDAVNQGMTHHEVWAVEPENVLNCHGYVRKCPDGRVLKYRFFERDVHDYEAGMRAAMADCAAAQQTDRAAGRQRLTSRTWFRNLPWRQPKLTRWEREALLALARGTAMPGRTFEDALKVLAKRLKRQSRNRRARRRAAVQRPITNATLIAEIRRINLGPPSAALKCMHRPDVPQISRSGQSPRPACPCESARARAPPGHHRPFTLSQAPRGDARPP